MPHLAPGQEYMPPPGGTTPWILPHHGRVREEGSFIDPGEWADPRAWIGTLLWFTISRR